MDRIRHDFPMSNTVTPIRHPGGLIADSDTAQSKQIKKRGHTVAPFSSAILESSLFNKHRLTSFSVYLDIAVLDISNVNEVRRSVSRCRFFKHDEDEVVGRTGIAIV